MLRSVVGSDFEEVDIDACPELLPRYSEEVPVVFVDGRQISYWTIDADRLRAALGGGFGPAAQCATSESAKETNACVE